MAGKRLPKQSRGLVCGIRVSTPFAGNRRCCRVGRRVQARMYRGSRRNQDPWQGSSQRWQGQQDRWEIWADSPPAAPPAKLPALVLDERVMTAQYAVQGQKTADGSRLPAPRPEDALGTRRFQEERRRSSRGHEGRRQSPSRTASGEAPP